MRTRGAADLKAIARDLRVAGSPGARGLQGKLRRNITAAMLPMKQEVQRNAFNIPAKGPGHTGLRVALMKATRIRIAPASRKTAVALIVDGKNMPAGQQSLPVLMEGERNWRHPVFGDREDWKPQQSHPFVAPAIPKYTAKAAAAIDHACDEIAAQLTRKGGL